MRPKSFSTHWDGPRAATPRGPPFLNLHANTTYKFAWQHFMLSVYKSWAAGGPQPIVHRVCAQISDESSDQGRRARLMIIQISSFSALDLTGLSMVHGCTKNYEESDREDLISASFKVFKMPNNIDSTCVDLIFLIIKYVNTNADDKNHLDRHRYTVWVWEIPGGWGGPYFTHCLASSGY